MLGTRSCFLFLLITSPFVSFLKKPLQNNVISNVIFSNCFQTWYFFLFPLFPSYWISWFSWISSLQLSPSVSCFSLSLTRCFFASRVIKAHYDRNKKKNQLKGIFHDYYYFWLNTCECQKNNYSQSVINFLFYLLKSTLTRSFKIILSVQF